MMPYFCFNTERLHIRPTAEADAAFILELFNSPGWLQHIGDRQVRTEAEAAQYIREKMRPQLERLGYSNYTMLRKEDHEKVGVCGLYDRPGLEGIDIGFALLPAFTKQGYAFEAVKKLKRVAKEQFEIWQMNAITTEANLASQKLLEKIGFAFRRTVRLPNDEEELMLYQWRADTICY